MRENTCLVVDVWEGQMEIDEAALKANGVAGMGIRINDMSGGHHMDTNFTKQWVAAKQFVRFPYFVYNPWVNGAANYNWLAANCPPEVRSIAVDMEVRYTGYSPNTYAGEFVKFLDLCKPKWKVIIYTAQWFLPYLSSWPKMDYWWAQYPDQTRYFANCTTWADLKTRLDNPILAQPFNASACPGTIKMWQFSGDYLILPGSNRDIDVNLFYGSPQQLSDYFMSVPEGTTPAPTPIPTPTPALPGAGLYTFASNNYFRRSGGGPLTLPMSRTQRLGDNMTRYNWEALKPTLLRLNSTFPAALDQIAAWDWGPTKGLDGAYIRWIGLLWPGRNVVQVEEVVYANGEPWGRVQGVPLDKLSTLSVYNTPHLVHQVYIYHPSNGWSPLPNPVYVPIMGGPWWVQINRLAPLSTQLPKVVKVTAFPRLRIRATPDGTSAITGYAYYNSSHTVTEVQIGSGGLWGKVQNGWIALRHMGTNWTNWQI